MSGINDLYSKKLPPTRNGIARSLNLLMYRDGSCWLDFKANNGRHRSIEISLKKATRLIRAAKLKHIRPR